MKSKFLLLLKISELLKRNNLKNKKYNIQDVYKLKNTY